MQNVDKNNRKLKGADSQLVSLRQKFERVRNYWNEKRGSWLAIDFEQWEMDSSMLTEFGYSCVEFIDGKEHQTDGHLIVKEYESYNNFKYIQGNKDVRARHLRKQMLIAPPRTITLGPVRRSRKSSSKNAYAP